MSEVVAKDAEGIANAIKIKAEAHLFAKQQEAVGVLAIMNAEAEGLQKLSSSIGGPDNYLQYLHLK